MNGQKTPIRLSEVTECKDFSNFCRITGHRLTWLSSFGLWEEECKNFEAEFSVCDTHLWQTYKTLQLASRKKHIILLAKNILSIQLISNKIFSYGLYTVFYKNFPALLEPYVQSGELSRNDIRFIKKDQFRTQALTWIFQTDEIYKDCDYGSEGNFKELILNEYRHEPYCLWYRIAYSVKRRYRRFLSVCRTRLEKNRIGNSLVALKRRLHIKLY